MSSEEPTPPPAAPPVAPPVTSGLPDMSQPPGPMAPAPTFLDRLIPGKNQNALISYYLGLFSIFPCLGLPMGFIAIRNGRLALAAAKADPSVAGGTHAKIGIGCGAIGFLFNLFWIVVLTIAFTFGRK